MILGFDPLSDCAWACLPEGGADCAPAEEDELQKALTMAIKARPVRQVERVVCVVVEVLYFDMI